MATKSYQLSTSVDTSVVKFNVTAAANGVGAVIPYTGYSSAITLANVSGAAGLEYSLNGGAWMFVGKGNAPLIQANTARDKIRLRLVNDGATSAQVEATIEGAVVAASSSITMPLPDVQRGARTVLVGDSNTHQNFDLGYITSLSRTNNVTTVVFSGPQFDMFPGSPINVVNVPASFSGNQFITGGSSATYTYDNPGPDEVAPIVGIPSAANLCKFMDNGWFVWGNILGGQKFDLVGMSAATGRTTDEMLARVGEVTSLDASVAFVMGGTNDVNGGRSAASIIANLQGIYDALLASGKNIYALTILPLGGGQWSAAKTAVILQVNAWIKGYCRAKNDMQFIDAYSATVDPIATNKGQAATGMLRTDGLHLTQRGAFAVGKLISAETASVPRSDFRTTNNADNYGTNVANANVQDFAPWAATGGTVAGPATGVLGNGITGQITAGSPTVLFSAPARADGFGFDSQADITAAASGDQIRIKTTDNIYPIARVPVGATVQADISVAFSSSAGKVLSSSFYFGGAVAGSTSRIFGLGVGTSAGAECIQEDWTGVIRTPAVRLPVVLSANPYTRFECTANGVVTFTVRAGRGEILVTTS